MNWFITILAKKKGREAGPWSSYSYIKLGDVQPECKSVIPGCILIYLVISDYFCLPLLIPGCIYLFLFNLGNLELSQAILGYSRLSGFSLDWSWIVPGLFLDYHFTILESYLDYLCIIPRLFQEYPLIFQGSSLDYPWIILQFSLYYPRVILWLPLDYLWIIPRLSLY